MFEYFYHEVIRKTVISFGTLFNEISIKHTNDSDQTVSTIRVPLAYGPTQKFLARLEQVPDLNKPIQISLPRMSFELVGITYDSSRKSTTTQTFLSGLKSDGSKITKTYLPVPYNLDFELSVFAKLNDDMLQIVEQILPYFQPAYTLTVDLLSTIGEKRDIPVVLNSVSMSDDYEGDFNTRRSLIYTLRFTAKTYLFGPIASSTVSDDIIKKVSIGFIAGGETSTPNREVTYSAEPRATKNYTGVVVTNLSKDVDVDDTIITVNDASNISENTYVYIDEEEMYVKSKSSNTLVVTRGADGSTVTKHVSGAEVKNITSQDNLLIEFGDDFGFSGTI
jgi:hypothetical protein